MYRKFEELNRVYADLVRKYREIEREKDQVNLEIEDTRRRYRAIEEEYGVMATKIEKYVNQMSRTNARVKERLQSQQALLDDVQPGLTDYL
jgi:predicted  nucleic acid-binding Zn-ribbon protein